MMDDLEEDVLQTSFGKSLLEKGNKIAFRKSEQKSIRGGLTGALPPCGAIGGLTGALPPCGAKGGLTGALPPWWISKG